MTSFKDYNRRIYNLLKRDRLLFLIMLLLFLAGIWQGGEITKTHPRIAQTIENMIQNKFGSMKDWLIDKPSYMWIFVIWFNNIRAAILSFLSGIVFFFPPLFVILQGVIVGLVQNLSITSHLSVTQFYISLLPHGIMELSAIFIISGLGVRFGFMLYRSFWRLLQGKDNQQLFKNFALEIRDYFILIIVMLFIAAIIEVTISPLVLRLI